MNANITKMQFFYFHHAFEKNKLLFYWMSQKPLIVTPSPYKRSFIKINFSGLFKAAKHEFICRACKQEFTSIPEYNNHLIDQHNLGYNYHCKANCGFTSSNLQIIRNHIKEEHMTCRYYIFGLVYLILY